MSLLLVEDDPDDLFALKYALKKINLSEKILVAEDGREALKYLSGEGIYADRTSYPVPSLILLDLKLPYFTGFEVLSWLRCQEELKAVNVVILSGSDEDRDHKMAKDLGAFDYLVKPASPEHLSKILTSLDIA